jgi:hypothetical protein
VGYGRPALPLFDIQSGTQCCGVSEGRVTANRYAPPFLDRDALPLARA